MGAAIGGAAVSDIIGPPDAAALRTRLVDIAAEAAADRQRQAASRQAAEAGRAAAQQADRRLIQVLLRIMVASKSAPGLWRARWLNLQNATSSASVRRAVQPLDAHEDAPANWWTNPCANCPWMSVSLSPR